MKIGHCVAIGLAWAILSVGCSPEGAITASDSSQAATVERTESADAQVNGPEHSEAYDAYCEKAEEYLGRFGLCELVDRDGIQGLTGLCLA